MTEPPGARPPRRLSHKACTLYLSGWESMQMRYREESLLSGHSMCQQAEVAYQRTSASGCHSLTSVQHIGGPHSTTAAIPDFPCKQQSKRFDCHSGWALNYSEENQGRLQKWDLVPPEHSAPWCSAELPCQHLFAVVQLPCRQPHLGQHRVLGELADQGRRCQGAPLGIAAQAGGQVKSEAVHMILLYPAAAWHSQCPLSV